jgi:asparagine synthetase B (glutamine-hydrolysing)
MTVDSELIFALAEQFRGRTAHALERLVGTMATAWLDEGREELMLARGMGRPLWVGTSTQELFFASTRAALDLVEEYSCVKLRKREVREGSVLLVNGGRIVGRDSFQPDMSFEEQPQLAVPAPNEARRTLARLATLHPILPTTRHPSGGPCRRSSPLFS